MADTRAPSLLDEDEEVEEERGDPATHASPSTVLNATLTCAFVVLS